jgi:cytochrome c-type biogenesis protein
MPDNLPVISFLIAFLAGFLSFLSPCVLPLVPAYISYITGISFNDLIDPQAKGKIRRITLINSGLFILGFSLVFITLGASATFIGNLLTNYVHIIRKIGSVFIILFGLYLTGAFKLNFLMQERRLEFGMNPHGYLSSILIGITFAAGWTPCVGPILASILLYASFSETMGTGIYLLISYSLGLAVPFLITALAITSFLSAFKRINKFIRYINLISGLLLIFMGILLFSDYLQFLNRYFINWENFSTLL